MDIRTLIDTRAMTRYQWFIIAIATFLNAMDGYDILAMAFTANSVATEFELSGSQLGLLISLGFIGMGIGSLSFGPLGDRLGRRPILLAALTLDGIGLLWSGVAGSAMELGIARLLTGIGVGGVLTVVTVITSEYSNKRNRGMAISIYAAGYGVGATLGGLLAAQLIPTTGWRGVFLAGAALSALGIVAVWAFIPESFDYLRTRGDLPRARQIATRLGIREEVTFPSTPVAADLPGSGAPRRGLPAVLGPSFLRNTLRLWGAFALITIGFQVASSWTPKLLEDAGMSAQQSIVGGLLLTLGGSFGSLIYGWLTTRFSAQGTLIAFSLGSAVLLVGFISSIPLPALAFALGVLTGMLLNGCIAGLYSIAPQIYPAGMRTTGVGVALGVGRVGAILAPLGVGVLIDAGISPLHIYLTVGCIMILGATTLRGITLHRETPVAMAEPALVEK